MVVMILRDNMNDLFVYVLVEVDFICRKFWFLTYLAI